MGGNNDTEAIFRRGYSEEDILRILRQIELELASGVTVETAIRTIDIGDTIYYKWRKLCGGMGKLPPDADRLSSGFGF